MNDANDMADALGELGFTVDKVLDGDLDQMESSIMRLKNRLSVSRNSYGFIFYAGHGVQSNGVNYLIPVGVSLPSENSLRERAVAVQFMLDELNDAGNELNIVVLDACRDNPFGWARSTSRGLVAITDQPADSIIVYATSAGSTASDGTGRNGLFTGQLLKNLTTPGLDVSEVFRRTGADVSQVSNRHQIPAVYNQFFGIAYLGQQPAASVPAQSESEPNPAPALTPLPAPSTAASSAQRGRTNTDSVEKRLNIRLSAGTDLLGGLRFIESTALSLDEFGNIVNKFPFSRTDTQFGFRAYLNAEFFRYVLLDASVYYTHTSDGDMRFDDGGRSGVYSTTNRWGLDFSLFGQYPFELNPSITIFPLLGLGYDLGLYSKATDDPPWGDTTTYEYNRSDLKDSDSLWLKIGSRLNYEFFRNFGFNATLMYNIFLYSKSISTAKSEGRLDNYSFHGPSLYVGLNYAFLAPPSVEQPEPTLSEEETVQGSKRREKWALGFRAGPQFTFGGAEYYTSNIGLYASLYGAYAFTSLFSLQTGLAFSVNNNNSISSDINYFRYTTLDMPVLPTFTWYPHRNVLIRLSIGPLLSLAVSDIHSYGPEGSINSFTNRFGVGILAGVGVGFRVGRGNFVFDIQSFGTTGQTYDTGYDKDMIHHTGLPMLLAGYEFWF